MSVLLGKGDGTFTTGPHQPSGASPKGIALGDFNGDGILDIATAELRTNRSRFCWATATALFSAPANPRPRILSPTGLAAADLNGDGLLDIVTSNQAATPTVLLQNVTSATTVTASGISVLATDNVFAQYSGDGNYSPSQSTATPLSSILLTAQTITFANPGPQVFVRR